MGKRRRKASRGRDGGVEGRQAEVLRGAERGNGRSRRLLPGSLLLPALLLLFVAMLLPPQMKAQPMQATDGGRQLNKPQRIASRAPAARHLIHDGRAAPMRQRRQSKPQESLWQLYFRLMREGNNDTVSAFQQVRQLFSTLIVPDRPSEDLTTTEQAVDEEDGSGNETVTTTTTEPSPRKISSGELMGIFRRNVFGLGRLFGREFWNAIQQSNKNIQTYSREWQEAIRPFVQ